MITLPERSPLRPQPTFSEDDWPVAVVNPAARESYPSQWLRPQARPTRNTTMLEPPHRTASASARLTRRGRAQAPPRLSFFRNCSAMATSSAAEAARKRWEIENNVVQTDDVYKFDGAEQDKLREAEPWKKEYCRPFARGFYSRYFLSYLRLSASLSLSLCRGFSLNVLLPCPHPFSVAPTTSRRSGSRALRF